MSANKTMIVTMALAVALTAGSGFAATSFTQDFSSGTQPANMTDVGTGGATISFTSFNAKFTSSRTFLSTTDTDYNTTNFVFKATLTIGSDTSSNATAFIGMGTGNNNGSFNAPGSPEVNAEIGPSGFANGFFRADDNGAQVGPLWGQGNGGWGANTVDRVIMIWNTATKQATFEVDQNYNGTFAADFTQVVNGADNGFTASNSRLFFGGGNGISWDDISVSVPTPAALPAGLALLAISAIRRRRV